MKNSLIDLTFCTVALHTSATPATVILSAPSTDWPVCPITVKQALTKVNGVIQAKVDFDKHQATVTFDDAKTDVQALSLATKNVGYPSMLVAPKK